MARCFADSTEFCVEPRHQSTTATSDDDSNWHANQSAINTGQENHGSTSERFVIFRRVIERRIGFLVPLVLVLRLLLLEVTIALPFVAVVFVGFTHKISGTKLRHRTR